MSQKQKPSDEDWECARLTVGLSYELHAKALRDIKEKVDSFEHRLHEYSLEELNERLEKHFQEGEEILKQYETSVTEMANIMGVEQTTANSAVKQFMSIVKSEHQ